MIKSSELLTLALNDHLSETNNASVNKYIYICVALDAACSATRSNSNFRTSSNLQRLIRDDIDRYTSKVLRLPTIDPTNISEIFTYIPHDFKCTAYEFRVNYTLMLIEYYKDQDD